MMVKYKPVLALLAIILIAAGTFYINKKILKKPQSLAENAYAVKEECRKEKKDQCYPEYFYKIAKESGYEKAFSLLTKLQSIDRDASNCHLIAHRIGEGAFEKDPKNWRETLQNADLSCSYGIGHGMIESYLSTLPEAELQNDSTLLSTCGTNNLPCVHTLGHVLMVHNNGDLEKSLNRCKILLGVENSACSNGAIMEYIYPVTLVEHKIKEKSALIPGGKLNSLTDLCNRMETENLQYICWGELARPILAEYSNPEESFAACSNAPFYRAATMCKRRVIDMLSAKNGFDLMANKYLCTVTQTPSDPSFEQTCYNELAYSGINVLPLTRAQEAVNFCLSVPEVFKASCIAKIGSTLKEKADGRKIDQICQKVPNEFRNNCLKGNST